MKTIKSFALQSHINASLIHAVVRQVGGWDSFKEITQDVSNHGAGAGFSGFIYHNETVPFARRNKKAILELAKEQASEIGSETIYEMVASFRCVDCTGYEVAEAIHSGKGDNVTQVYNALAWYALEEVCRSYCDIKDNE